MRAIQAVGVFVMQQGIRTNIYRSKPQQAAVEKIDREEGIFPLISLDLRPMVFRASDKGVALLAWGYRASVNSLPSARSWDSTKRQEPIEEAARCARPQ